MWIARWGIWPRHWIGWRRGGDALREVQARTSLPLQPPLESHARIWRVSLPVTCEPAVSLLAPVCRPEIITIRRGRPVSWKITLGNRRSPVTSRPFALLSAGATPLARRESDARAPNSLFGAFWMSWKQRTSVAPQFCGSRRPPTLKKLPDDWGIAIPQSFCAPKRCYHAR